MQERDIQAGGYVAGRLSLLHEKAVQAARRLSQVPPLQAGRQVSPRTGCAIDVRRGNLVFMSAIARESISTLKDESAPIRARLFA